MVVFLPKQAESKVAREVKVGDKSLVQIRVEAFNRFSCNLGQHIV